MSAGQHLMHQLVEHFAWFYTLSKTVPVHRHPPVLPSSWKESQKWAGYWYKAIALIHSFLGPVNFAQINAQCTKTFLVAINLQCNSYDLADTKGYHKEICVSWSGSRWYELYDVIHSGNCTAHHREFPLGSGKLSSQHLYICISRG